MGSDSADSFLIQSSLIQESQVRKNSTKALTHLYYTSRRRGQDQKPNQAMELQRTNSEDDEEPGTEKGT